MNASRSFDEHVMTTTWINERFYCFENDDFSLKDQSRLTVWQRPMSRTETKTLKKIPENDQRWTSMDHSNRVLLLTLWSIFIQCIFSHKISNWEPFKQNVYFAWWPTFKNAIVKLCVCGVEKQSGKFLHLVPLDFALVFLFKKSMLSCNIYRNGFL